MVSVNSVYNLAAVIGDPFLPFNWTVSNRPFVSLPHKDEVDKGLYLSFITSILPSVLWHCWLGGRKGIRPVKTEWWPGGVLAWLFVWSEVQTFIWPSWCHCHSLSLASVKSTLVLPFWYWMTRVVLDKGLLNGCVFVCMFHNKYVAVEPTFMQSTCCATTAAVNICCPCQISAANPTADTSTDWPTLIQFMTLTAYYIRAACGPRVSSGVVPPSLHRGALASSVLHLVKAQLGFSVCAVSSGVCLRFQ